MENVDMHFFPVIDFYDVNGNEYRVIEAIESRTVDGFKKITYKLINNEEISFVIK